MILYMYIIYTIVYTIIAYMYTIITMYNYVYICIYIYGMVFLCVILTRCFYIAALLFNPIVSRPLPISGIPFWLVTISRLSCCQLLSSISHSPSPQRFLFLCFFFFFFFSLYSLFSYSYGDPFYYCLLLSIVSLLLL